MRLPLTLITVIVAATAVTTRDQRQHLRQSDEPLLKMIGNTNAVGLLTGMSLDQKNDLLSQSQTNTAIPTMTSDYFVRSDGDETHFSESHTSEKMQAARGDGAEAAVDPRGNQKQQQQQEDQEDQEDDKDDKDDKDDEDNEDDEHVSSKFESSSEEEDIEGGSTDCNECACGR